MKTGKQTFLDLGCCFGQEVRRLVADGAPSEKLYGSDLREDFFKLGYDLFKDGETLKTKFIAADIFDSESGLKQINGEIDIIYAGSFLHLFDYQKQEAICVRIVKLLRQKPGSLLVGRQVGHEEAGAKAHRTNPDGEMFRHNVQSFKEMWEEVGKKTGTKWKVDASLSRADFGNRWQWQKDPGLARITFSVTRL